jgi:hypothetical protein
MFSSKGVKMTPAKWTINTGEQSSRIWAILLQGLMKRVVCQCEGVEMKIKVKSSSQNQSRILGIIFFYNYI